MAIDTGTPEPRSRRAILAGAIGGVAGLIGSRFVSPDRTSAAAGGPVIMGAANSAGVTNTSLTTASSGTALLITQNGAGTALRGSAVGPGSIAGFFTANNGTGISGVTGNGGTYGVFAQNNGAAGIAGALRASGGNNHGVVATTAHANANAVKAVNGALDGTAILGAATATTGSLGVGIRGETDGESGSGVVGFANSDTGTPNGVFGGAIGSGGNAVHGQMYAVTFANGVAVRASGGSNHGVVAATSSNFAYAVHATQSGSNGTAIKGEVTTAGGTGIGVHGEIPADGYAVFGHATGIGRGVLGQSDGDSAIGTLGFASSASGSTRGVYGVANSTIGIGVLGNAQAATGFTYGVYGTTLSPDGVALYSNGNAKVVGALDVTGAITAGTKDFRIDHPLDPASKFLSHSCVESDDRRTVYDGEVTLDAKGEATVTLPAWFGALNGQARIQLTAIGAAAPDLHVKTKVADNRFAIAGGANGQEVYWHLSAIRQDPYAKAHPLAVEATKAGTERGRYLHPEVYGKAASKSIGALRAHPLPVVDPTGASAPAPGH